MLPDTGAIGRYEIKRRVARGGMGTLYLAQDPVLGRQVAVKVFLGDLELPDARERFVREARSAAALSHPNIVTIYDYGEFEAQPYIVMEFIHGETLAAIIRRRPALQVWTKLQWMEELCSAVEYAHAHGVIHRDLKPLNLMVDGYGRLKVLDFGIARMRGTLVSHATARVGTAGYMAPEQIRGGNIDHRSDLFSIGVVCYELLTHVEPFGCDIDVAVTNRILGEEPKPLQEFEPDIDPQLAELVWKALRKDPGERVQDAAELRQSFAAVRRRLEAAASDTANESRSVFTPITGAPAEMAGRGSDGANAPTSASRRTERDALVMQRTAEIKASLQLAREHFAAGQLLPAKTECERVLTLDAEQPEALELMRAVGLQIARADAAVLIRRGHEELERGAITKAVELLDRARVLAPDSLDNSRLDRALRLARAQHDIDRRRAERFRQAVRAAEEALDYGHLEEALSHAREALEIDPASEPARALEQGALRRIEDETGAAMEETGEMALGRQSGPTDPTMLSPANARAGAGGGAAAGVATTAKPATDRENENARPRSAKQSATAWLKSQGERWQRMRSAQRWMILSGAATVVILAAVLTVWATRTPQRLPPRRPQSCQFSFRSSSTQFLGRTSEGLSARIANQWR